VELATAYVSIVSETGSLAPSVTRSLGGVESAAAASGRRSGKAMAGGLALGLKGLAAIGATLAVGDFIKDSIAEARESQKVGAITTQIIKSTGGAAKLTADQVGELAGRLSVKNGVDDEAIQKGANLLLTFKKVKNEAGDGANVFDRATAAAVDLSAAGFGSIEGSSKMLGKALNDPVKGITALSRAGVTFTEQQKDQIKTLVKSGDVLGAQKLILKEVESQVGGVGAASATAGEKAKVAYDNMKEAIGTALLPALDAVQNTAARVFLWLTENVPKALRFVSDFISPWVDRFKAAFSGIETGVTSPVGRLRAFVLDAFGAIVAYVKAEILPRVEGIAGAFSRLVQTAVPIVQDFVGRVITLFMSFMPTIKSILGTVGQIVTGGLDLVRAIVERVTTIIAWVWKNWGQGLMDWIKVIWSAILGVIKPALETIRNLIRVFTSIFKGDWSGAWDAIKATLSSAWATIKGIIGGALSIVKQLLSTAWSVIASVASAAWGRIVDGIRFWWNDLSRGVSEKIASIKKTLSGAWASIKSVATGAWSGIVSAISGAWNKVTSAISGPIDRAKQFIQENLIDKVNGLFEFLRLPLHISPIWTKAASPRAPGGRMGGSWAGGGVLPGYTPGRDVHTFFSPTGGRLNLSGGEAIMRPEWTKMIGGPRMVAHLNDMAKRGQSFAGGGIFETIGNIANGFLGFVTDPLGSIKKMFANVIGALGNSPIVQMVGGMFGRLAGGLAEKAMALFGMGGTGSIPATGVQVGSNRLDADTLRRIKAAGGFRVIQGSWSHNPLSKGTHAGAGAADLVTSNWAGGVARLRAQGMLAMFRNWVGNRHIHALNPWVQGLSPQALQQVRNARANNGIFSGGGVVPIHLAGTLDQGGYLMPGLNLAYNGLGRPEPVGDAIGGLSSADIDRLVDALYEAARGGIRDGMTDRQRVEKIARRLAVGVQS
jgi:phage-related protein